MTRMGFLPWCEEVFETLDSPTTKVDPADLELMWNAHIAPAAAAAAITVAEFERTLNA